MGLLWNSSPLLYMESHGCLLKGYLFYIDLSHLHGALLLDTTLLCKECWGMTGTIQLSNFLLEHAHFKSTIQIIMFQSVFIL